MTLTDELINEFPGSEVERASAGHPILTLSPKLRRRLWRGPSVCLAYSRSAEAITKLLSSLDSAGGTVRVSVLLAKDGPWPDVTEHELNAISQFWRNRRGTTPVSNIWIQTAAMWLRAAKARIETRFVEVRIREDEYKTTVRNIEALFSLPPLAGMQREPFSANALFESLAERPSERNSATR